MPRPKHGYALKDGTQVPGTTTICGRFKDSGALIYWAWKQGCDGKDLRETVEQAGDAGTCGHDMCECELDSRTFDPTKYAPSTVKLAEHAFLGFLEWKEQTKLKIVWKEESMVSELYRFGGTPDWVVDINGKLRIIDLKTSNGIYQDYMIQVAGAYTLLWQEHFPDKPLSGIDLLRVSKPKDDDDPVSFHHHSWSAEAFAPCQEQFLLFRRAFDLDKRLKSLL
jgi:hypothetical protein